MPIAGPLDYLPLWGILGVTVVLVLVVIEGGYRVGKARRLRSANEKEAPVGAIVAATLGLLGLILAFSFGLVASRFDSRKQIVVMEANAIGTTYLRAGLLPNGRGVKIRELLVEYVDARIEVIQTGDVDLVLRRTNELHRKLWREAEEIGQAYPNSIVVGLFIQALNDTIDMHSMRVLVGLRSRLPTVLWVTLYLVTMMTMAGVGYHEGLSKSIRSIAVFLLVLAFAIILTLVADLDRPREGLLTTNQQAMTDLREMMNDAR